MSIHGNCIFRKYEIFQNYLLQPTHFLIIINFKTHFSQKLVRKVTKILFFILNNGKLPTFKFRGNFKIRLNFSRSWSDLHDAIWGNFSVWWKLKDFRSFWNIFNWTKFINMVEYFWTLRFSWHMIRRIWSKKL